MQDTSLVQGDSPLTPHMSNSRVYRPPAKYPVVAKVNMAIYSPKWLFIPQCGLFPYLAIF